MIVRYGIILSLFFASCSPFGKIAKSTVIQNEDSYLAIQNAQAGIKALTFGDFQFATTRKEYKVLHPSKSHFKDILVYAQASEPAYEYYILYNPKDEMPDTSVFLVKDTLIGQSHIRLLISDGAPQKDVVFLQNHLSKE